MTLLVLGGTNEAIQLTRAFIDVGIHVIYSIAGLVRQPNLSCTVISGGFQKYGGLTQFAQQHSVSAILDVTHPFAQNISQSAAETTQELSIYYWRFERPPWQKQPGDHWFYFENWDSLFPQIRNKKRIFMTTGQPKKDTLAHLANHSEMVLMRTAVQPEFKLPANVQWRQAIGPFSKNAELKLMADNGIDALVTKHSGGDATVAKINAARELGIDVFLQQRPVLPKAHQTYSEIAECQASVCKVMRTLTRRN
jgi:precorrin-6A/cobalt-precorrin-6A reductase